jgi:hypothetical protein
MPEWEQREMLDSISGETTNADGHGKKAGKPKKRKTRKSKSQPGAGAGDVVPAAEVENLRAELATANKRQRELEEELEKARAAAGRTPPVDGSAKLDLDIPGSLLRLSPEDQKAVNDIVEAWDRHMQPLWEKASPLIRRRFQALRMTGTD